MINELNIFSGSGGGIIASKFILKWRIIGYVERDNACQKSIRQRILDGSIDNAPIYGDIRTFIDTGCARIYKGITDIISAGFPCQPFSKAGSKKGVDDERNAWPETFECISIIRPGCVILENVPGLLTNKYINTIFSNLASLGYDFAYDVLPAAAFGADHLRERLWIVAYSRGIGLEKARSEIINSKTICGKRTWFSSPVEINPIDRINRHSESPFLRKYDGVASWMDRIKAIGNGQYPAVVEQAWNRLTERILRSTL